MFEKLNSKFLTSKKKKGISLSILSFLSFSFISPVFCQELTSCSKHQTTWLDYFIDPGFDVRHQEATELQQKLNFYFELNNSIPEDKNLEFNIQIVSSSHEGIDIDFSQPILDDTRKNISFDAQFISVPPELNNEIETYWVEFAVEVTCKNGDKTIWNTTIDDLQLLIEIEPPRPFTGNFLSISTDKSTTICIKVVNQTVCYNEKPSIDWWHNRKFINRLPKLHYWLADKWEPVDFGLPRETFDTHHWTQTYTFNIETSYDNSIIYFQGWNDKQDGLSCYEFDEEKNIANSSIVNIVSGEEEDDSEWTVGGTVMSLLNRGAEETDEIINKSGCFCGLFEGNKNITTISNPETFLPAKNLDGSNYCYQAMFKDCTLLENVPDIVIQNTIPSFCCCQMFSGCSSLKTLENSKLACNGLSPYCYSEMFMDCSSLTKSYEQLSTDNLAEYCYNKMFANCESLEACPELLATNLANGCYYQMFYNCDSLTSSTFLPATSLNNYCYYKMFYDCNSIIDVKQIGVHDESVSVSVEENACNEMFYLESDKKPNKWIEIEACQSSDEGWIIHFTNIAFQGCYQMFGTLRGWRVLPTPSKNNFYKIVVKS